MVNKFVVWLRRKHPGSLFKLRDFVLNTGLFGIAPLTASLSIRVIRKNGDIEDKGVVSTHAVTDVFVNQLVDTLQSSVAAFSTYKYHDSGTDDTAEDQTDTGLGAACGEARDVGTQTEGDTANIYKSVATHTYATSFAITEHILANAATNGDTMDRSVFSDINVDAGDKIEFTYQLTCTAGG